MDPNGVMMTMMMIMTTIFVHPHVIVPYEWGTYSMKATRSTSNITPPVKSTRFKGIMFEPQKNHNLRLA